MPSKLRFRWWVTKEYNGSYQLGTLVGELLSKWINVFRLKPYKGRMLENLFKEPGETREYRRPDRNQGHPGSNGGGTGRTQFY